MSPIGPDLDVIPRRGDRHSVAGPDVRHANAAPLEAGGRHELALAPVGVAVRAANGEQLFGDWDTLDYNCNWDYM